jgi:hypothetical protein
MEDGLQAEHYLQQFHNYDHHTQDENYRKPEWHNMEERPIKPNAMLAHYAAIHQPMQQMQQAPQQINPGNTLGSMISY